MEERMTQLLSAEVGSEKTSSTTKILKPARLLPKKEVMDRTGLANSSLYAMIARDEFPAPIKISERSVRWLESAIDRWITDKVAAAGKEKK